MQTILGAGGSIGIELAKSLPSYTNKIRLVGRNPSRVNATDELFKADLLNAVSVREAVKGSEVAYLTIGLPYEAKVWEDAWPKVMANTIQACKEEQCKLVFFDNMYMYDPETLQDMTENSAVLPVSRKGKVRKAIAEQLMQAHEKGDVKALIARAADFYGPGISNSVLQISVVDNLVKGKKANWFCSTRFKHSFTFTPDAGKATAILGNDPKAFGEIWHMPTANNPLTGDAWIKAFAEEIGTEPKVQIAGKTVTKLLGLFNPVMKEFVEMLYQWDRDYVFNSNKFEKAYNFKPTSYDEGIRKVASAAQKT